jgi:hypothetical protein
MEREAKKEDGGMAHGTHGILGRKTDGGNGNA